MLYKFYALMAILAASLAGFTGCNVEVDEAADSVEVEPPKDVDVDVDVDRKP
jgi:hypothetical protein